MPESTVYQCLQYVKARQWLHGESLKGFKERRAFTALLDQQILSFLRLQREQRLQDLYTLKIVSDMPPNVQQIILQQVRAGRSSRAQWESIVRQLLSERQRGPMSPRGKQPRPPAASCAAQQASGCVGEACMRQRHPLQGAPWVQQLKQEGLLELQLD